VRGVALPLQRGRDLGEEEELGVRRGGGGGGTEDAAFPVREVEWSTTGCIGRFPFFGVFAGRSWSSH
jgi:hypothetical protein